MISAYKNLGSNQNCPLAFHAFAARVGLSLLVAILAACGSGEKAAPKAQSAAKPKRNPNALNLILITLDTTRADRLGCYGYAKAWTPNLDKLAAEGILFGQMYCQTAMTLPSHASILTGLFPTRHGIHINGPFRLSSKIPLLPEILKREGYSTAAFVSAFVLNSQFGLDRGFDLYDDEVPVGVMDIPERRGDETAIRAAIWLVKHNPETPFFLWMHLFDPHFPYEAPYDISKKDLDPYDGEIAFADSCVGTLLDALEQSGQRDRTLVVVTADHGEGLGEHGEAIHSLFIYDSTLKVPLIIRAPAKFHIGAWAAGSRVDSLAQSADLLPTLLAMLEIPNSYGFDGKNLVETTRDHPGQDALLYAEALYPAAFGWSPLFSARDAKLKRILAPTAELYDYRTDPGESHNLDSQLKADASALDSKIKEIRAQSLEVEQTPSSTNANLESIRKLGYIGAGGSVDPNADFEGLPDPKTKTKVFDAINAARHTTSGNLPADSVALLEPFAETEKDNPIFLQVFGEALIASGDRTRGTEMLERAVAISPEDPDLAMRLANTYLNAGRAKDALELLEPITHENPAYSEGWDLLGVARGMIQDWKGAIEAGQRALALVPEHPDYRAHFGVTLLRTDHPREAEAEFRAALSSRDSLDNRFNLALALNLQQRYSESAPMFETILKERPEHLEAAERLVVAKYKLGEKAESRRLAEAMVAAGTVTPLAVYYLGLARADASEFADAIRDFESAAKGLPDFQPIYESWRDALTKSPDAASAGRLLEVARKRPLGFSKDDLLKLEAVALAKAQPALTTP